MAIRVSQKLSQIICENNFLIIFIPQKPVNQFSTLAVELQRLIILKYWETFGILQQTILD